MSQFDQICREFEQLSPADYVNIVGEKSVNIIQVLQAAFDNNAQDVINTYASFLVSVIAADGRMTEEEYLVCSPVFEAFFGDSIDFNQIMQLVKSTLNNEANIRSYVDSIVDALGEVDLSIKSDMVTVALAICAVDGKVSDAEKRWISRLMD